MTTPTLDLPQGNTPPISAPTPGVGAANQAEYQTQLAQFATAQQQADQTQPDQQVEKDTSHGWSWTNPFQDVGQIWHDVETHTVSPVFHATHWLYTNLVSRPIATSELYVANSSLTGNVLPFSGSQWKDSWDESAHISPGQALVIAENNSPIEQRLSNADDLPASAIGKNVRLIDPSNQDQVNQVFQNNSTKNAWGIKLQSGLADGLIGWYGDPTQHLTKGLKALKDIKDVPITKADSAAQAAQKLDRPESKAFDEWAVGKPISQIAEHPLVKGSGLRPNAFRYQMAALIAGAKSPDEVAAIRRIAMGAERNIQATATHVLDQTGLDVLTGGVPSAGKELDKLAAVAPNTAVQVNNLFDPMEIADKWALTASSDDEKLDWLQKVSKAKSAAAQHAVNIDPEQAERLTGIRGSGLTRTATTNIANRLAEVTGNLKYANTRESDGVKLWHQAMYNFPVRVYQSLTDRPPGMINHNDDDAIVSARSWLNKSSVLTPEEKNGFIQQYADATPAQRQHTWRSIENAVYSRVGENYGISDNTMSRILNTTRARQQTLTQLARSKAFGVIRLGDDEHAVMPTTSSEVVLHPQYLAQLERGAVPQANLRDLENALEIMNSNGVLPALTAGRLRVADTLNSLLDTVYGIWRPASLMNMHRAFNHIGDDFLRGVAKLGAITSIHHAAEGAYNFMSNRYNQLTRNAIMRNITHQHEMVVAQARADWEGARALAKTQKDLKIPQDLRTIQPGDVADRWNRYNQLRGIQLDYIPTRFRLGEGTFRIAGSNLAFSEMFGGPNADYLRWLTSSHPTWNAMVDDLAHLLHSSATAVRSGNFGTISASDDVARHTRAYVHYVRNQIMSDPVGRMVVQGRDLNDVARWLTGTGDGRAHMRALHIGDADQWVQSIAEDVRDKLPTDEMREAASTGKFNADVIEHNMPTSAMRPDVVAHIGDTLYGGDPLVNWLRRSMDNAMRWTGTLPDDAMVRHPFVNAMYKNRLTDLVQRRIAQTGRDITLRELEPLQIAAMKGARKDLQNTMYDVSRFNDAGHTLRFISPFFNAWFNAMSSWSRLFAENPTLLSRTYQAKRALWNSPFSINTDTGQKADVNTPWDKTSFVIHMPKALSGALGGLTDVPIDAKTLISPTYIDSIGNPGFGPLVSIPLNAIVKDHPTLMNDAVVRSMLNEMVDKNSMSQLLPSSARDVGTISQILMGAPDSSKAYADTVWSIYQEQMYDYYNGQRTEKPNWSDIQNQAKYLTVVDLVANRLMPLGFQPAPAHSMLINEYHSMLDKDPNNAKQDFYDKYGPAGMVFTQSLSTDPTGIPATVGASALVKKYAALIQQYPELGAAIVGPNGNGNYDQMAYQWQVANGIRKELSPQDAAAQAQVSIGWQQWGQVHAAAMAQLQSRGLTSLNDPAARDIKAQVTNYVSRLEDPQDPLYNPDWTKNYGSFNQGDYQNRLTALLSIAQDPKLLGNATRSDMRSLAAYAQVRSEVYAQLQKRNNKSITAAANFDLAQSLDKYVSQTMHDDTKFGQLYERYLAKDDFKEPLSAT